MNNEMLQTIALESSNLNEFIETLFKQTKPYKTVKKENVGEYVRIAASTYGVKNHLEYNMSCPKEGKILKVNRVSFSIKSPDGREYKIPMESLISDDISEIININMKNVDYHYNELKARAN